MGINAVVIVMKMINRLVILLGGDAVIGGSALECLLMDVLLYSDLTYTERQDSFNSYSCGAVVVRVRLVGATQPPIPSFSAISDRSFCRPFDLPNSAFFARTVANRPNGR